MSPRDHQEILDSAFAKLEIAGVTNDHRRRWETTSLTPVEKVQLILNDLYCEAMRGGADYWLQRCYCARGHVELQRVMAAIVEQHRALDEVAAEIVLAMCEAVELSPPAVDPSYAEATRTTADYDTYARVTRPYAFADACYYAMAERMLALNERVVDAWREDVDPFDLPLARAPARARRHLAVAVPSDGPVAFPAATLGVTRDGDACAIRIASADPFDVFNTAALALFVAGASLATIDELVVACMDVRGDMREVLARCARLVDLDGTLGRTGVVADVDAVVARLVAEHAAVLGPVATAMGGGDDLVALMKRPHGLVAVVGSSPPHRRAVARALVDYLQGCNVIAVVETGEPELAEHRTIVVPRDEIAAGVRAALRWDPDCVLVAPMTGAAAPLLVQGALTGHLMVCEVEASSVVEELSRHGCEPFLIASALVGIVHVADGPRIERVTTLVTAHREAIARGEPGEL